MIALLVCASSTVLAAPAPTAPRGRRRRPGAAPVAPASPSGAAPAVGAANKLADERGCTSSRARRALQRSKNFDAALAEDFQGAYAISGEAVVFCTTSASNT